MAKPVEWTQARGRCGFNVPGPVFGAYCNGVALFCWQDSRQWWQCVVTGHLSTGGVTQVLAQMAGEEFARRYGVKESDRRMSRRQFAATMESEA